MCVCGARAGKPVGEYECATDVDGDGLLTSAICLRRRGDVGRVGAAGIVVSKSATVVTAGSNVALVDGN